jgi:hypothetical protein
MPGSSQASPLLLGTKPLDGADIDEVFRRLEEPGTWVALYNVEVVPAYRAFLEEVLEGVREVAEREQSGILDVKGYIFISAPPSVTPFHIDRENNCWLQIKGRKVINVWADTDREVVAAAEVENFIVDASLENVRLKEGFMRRSQEFDVGPGQGVYFPSISPHTTRTEPGWTRPGDRVSVSVGVVFYTGHTRRLAYIHALNQVLRRLGFSPRDPGRSATVDRLKYLCGRVVVWGKQAFRGYKPQVGF